MGGEAGTGIKNSALILAKAFVNGGYYVHADVEYPSIVRGGNNTLEVRVSERPVRSLDDHIDLLAALDGRTVAMWADEVARGGTILYDAAHVAVQPQGLTPARIAAIKKAGVHVLDVPLRQLLAKEKLPLVMLNTVMLGAICALVCYDLPLLDQEIESVFGRKGREVVKANIRAAMAGYTYVASHYKEHFNCQPPLKSKQRLLLEGNAAILLGALRAGMTAYLGYPMTPTSSLLHATAALKQRYTVFSYQPEDEISAIQMALGASYAGARAMTASSGGGFSLMVESLGIAAMTEIPLVILLGQRPGPATGLPTRTGQGDVRFALHAGQDEPPRIVLAPGDPEEAFELTFAAFNLAEQFQLLVIVLGDKYMQESFWTQDRALTPKKLKVARGKRLTEAQALRLKSYERYALTADGVSPWVLPGTQNLATIWRTSGDEHDTRGFITEDRDNRNAMVKKRRQKMVTAYQQGVVPLEPVKSYGASDAKTAVVSFGSNKGVLLDALDELGADLKVVMVRCLMPFPAAELTAQLKGVERVLVVEGNDTGLFEGLLREHCRISPVASLRFYDGRPLRQPQVVEFIKKNSKIKRRAIV